MIASVWAPSVLRPFRAWKRGSVDSEPRPLAWAGLGRPFGAQKRGSADLLSKVCGFSFCCSDEPRT
jgi:hypothetical protein